MKKKLLNALTLVIFLSISNVNFGQAPGLGTSSGFTLFTATGAFDNIGATNITGDIGANVGPVTGFPPGMVSGVIHMADPVSAQAAADIEASYSALNGTSCGTTIGTPLGNNQILTQGVYCIATASVLNGDLILDGENDPDALFIFKINGTLSTNTLSKIILINSASLLNVYWQIDGQLTLGDNSVFRGTAIVNGAISLLEGASLLGRGLSRGGAISLQNNSASISEPIVLAIKLSAINAVNEGRQNRISWVTESESIGDTVELERSDDRRSFTQIGIIPGNAQPSSYSYRDKHPFTGLNLYRLKMKDFSGNFTYSRIVTAIMKASDQYTIEVYPNPGKDNISVIINGMAGNNSIISLSDITGKEVKRVTARDNKTDVSIVDLPKGVYFIKYFDSTRSQTIKIIKQ